MHWGLECHKHKLVVQTSANDWCNARFNSFDKRQVRRLLAARASLPNKLSTLYTRGVNWRRWSTQASTCLSFVAFLACSYFLGWLTSIRLSIFEGNLNIKYRILSVLEYQRSLWSVISKSLWWCNRVATCWRARYCNQNANSAAPRAASRQERHRVQDRSQHHGDQLIV